MRAWLGGRAATEIGEVKRMTYEEDHPMTTEEAHQTLASIVAQPGQVLSRLTHTGMDRWAVGDDRSDQPRLSGLSFVEAVQEYARRATSKASPLGHD